MEKSCKDNNRYKIIIAVLVVLLIAVCIFALIHTRKHGSEDDVFAHNELKTPLDVDNSDGYELDESEDDIGYMQITQEEAKHLMDTEKNYVILDVREQEEFDEQHIPGAKLLPYTQIEDKAAEELPDKNQLILVYCRSGRRSKIAAESLAKLGYMNVKEFGGIIDWKYDIE